MAKKRSIYLFNQANPRGVMLNLTVDEIKQHQEDGWLDSPASLDTPKDDDTGLSKEDVENARPDDLVALVKGYGFIVMTPDQLKAEANKMAELVLDIGKFTDEELIAEAERRGLKESAPDDTSIDEASNFSGDEDHVMDRDDNKGDPVGAEIYDPNGSFISRFNHSPTSLTKEELIILGNDYDLKLRMNMLEATMIGKITQAINPEGQE